MELTLSNTKSVFCHKTGKGKIKLLCIPGGPGFSHDYLLTFHENLNASDYTVISYEPSGFPNSTKNGMLKSISSASKELEEVLNVIEWDDCILFAHSWSAAVVLKFLAENPSFSGKAIISNSGISHAQTLNGIHKRAAALPDNFLERYKNLLNNGNIEDAETLLLQYWVPNHLIRNSNVPEAFMKSIGSALSSPMYYYWVGFDLLTMAGAFTLWDGTEDLKKINQQILWVSGTHDYVAREEHESNVKKIKNGKLFYLEGTAHTPFHEKPEEFFNEIKKFCSS